MTPYDMLFADQPLADLVLEAEFPARSPLEVARARLWEGNLAEVVTAAATAPEPFASYVLALARKNAGQSPKRTLRGIAENGAYGSRERAWAWTALRAEGDQPEAIYANDVLGVVVEVPVDDGLDVLAAYSDGSVRYLGHADQLIMREPTDAPSARVDALLASAFPLLKISAAPRDPAAEPPPPEKVRLSAISARGVHQLEAPWAEVEKGGPYESVFVAAIELLREITQS